MVCTLHPLCLHLWKSLLILDPMQFACYKNNRKYSIIYRNKFVALRTDPTTYLHFVTLFPVAALLTLGCSFPAASHTYATTTTISGVSLHCSRATNHNVIDPSQSQNTIRTFRGLYKDKTWILRNHSIQQEHSERWNTTICNYQTSRSVMELLSKTFAL